MINYRLVQDHSSNPRKSGKWYAKAVIGQTVSTDVIAERIEKKCSCTISDVKAVLEAASRPACRAAVPRRRTSSKCRSTSRDCT